MDRVNKIYSHPLYQENFKELLEAEKTRKFCNHTLEHFLDTARLMYIYNLEDGAGISKDLIYACALLHDIGRYVEITKGTSHDEASADLTKVIMPQSGFSQDETDIVAEAILGHRGDGKASTSPLAAYLYRADKASRNCFACDARETCKWPKEKMNLEIKY